MIDVVYSSRCRSSGFIPGGDFAKQLKKEKKNFLNAIVYGAKERKRDNQIVPTDAVDSVPLIIPPAMILRYDS